MNGEHVAGVDGRSWPGKHPLTGHKLSDFGLLSHLERVIYLEVSAVCRTSLDSSTTDHRLKLP